MPIHDGDKNASSGFSSRGCSPSPCESLSSDAALFNGDLNTAENSISDANCTKGNVVTDNGISKISFKKIKSDSDIFERPSSSAPTQNKEYLQSFDRRHSDSNYMSNHTSNFEKVNLAEEIKKLSDRLLMLSSINAKQQDNNQRTTENKTESLGTSSTKENMWFDKSVSTIAAVNNKTISMELTKNLKNSELTNGCSESNESNQIESSAVAATLTIRNSSSNKSIPLVNDSVFTHSKPTISTFGNLINAERFVSKPLDARNNSAKPSTNDSNSDLLISMNNSDLSSSNSSYNNSAPWPVTNRRTKYRITQLSRDVSHDTIFLEEAANTTKCLLHLLEKYNGREESRSSSSIRRHQSISVGGSIANNLEYQSMNSINAFFKRNVFQKNGTIVKQIQTRLEAKSNH